MEQYLMSDISGDKYYTLSGLRELWPCPNTGLFPVLGYYALSGLIQFKHLLTFFQSIFSIYWDFKNRDWKSHPKLL